MKNLQAGSTVVVTCKTKKKKQQKKGCAYKSKRFTTTGARAKPQPAQAVPKKKIPVGTKIAITITAPGYLGKRFTLHDPRSASCPSRACSASAPAADPAAAPDRRLGKGAAPVRERRPSSLTELAD